MEEKSNMDKLDEIMLPGFRFHPTDEELVGFYLRRKIQQKPLSIELIKQLEIYKYDPWDLPKLATTGEKEWYFYCPRDRKYRNSARPNRVTSAGFWKATGTDRPIYSSEEAKCIGLKKSLVFYKGRAAKGVKTDWMMHEFRLPSFNDPSVSKRPLDKNLIPANESWAICRIFKKTNTSAQRALSHPWGSLLPEATVFDKNYLPHAFNGVHFGSENIQFGCGSGLEQHSTALTYPSYDVTAFKPTSFMFSPQDQTSMDSKPSVDMASMLAVLQDAEKPSPSTGFGQQHSSGFTVTYPLEANSRNLGAEEDEVVGKKTGCSITFDSSAQWEGMRNVSFPFNLAPNSSEEWKLNLPWEPTMCPSDMSTGYSTNRV